MLLQLVGCSYCICINDITNSQLETIMSLWCCWSSIWKGFSSIWMTVCSHQKRSSKHCFASGLPRALLDSLYSRKSLDETDARSCSSCSTINWFWKCWCDHIVLHQLTNLVAQCILGTVVVLFKAKTGPCSKFKPLLRIIS